MRIILGIALAFGLSGCAAHAFSLLGPYEIWMQPTNGFRQPGDIGGPMNLGEEYRWNVPVLTYSFDQSFLDYFGSNGVAAVEQAMQILNALPPVSQLDLTNFPPEAMRVNYQAQALGLTDLKSKTLAALLEQLGLAQPTRFTFNVRDFAFINGDLVAQVIRRNFDPFNLAPTNRVNDSAHDYDLQVTTNGAFISVTAEEFLIDPLDVPAVADGALNTGEFYTGLPRDDVGGLRYLLHTNNANIEILLPGVHGIGPNAGAYADLALRRGVDKITFVRRDYDGFTGQFFTLYTNQFTDTYLSNSIVVTQQLERVVTVPDFLFSASTGNQGVITNAQITRTGTTNWWNAAFPPGAAGPGLIRPPIQLTFSKPAAVLVTADNGSHAPELYLSYWGSFDGSTNPPVAYANGTGIYDLTLNLHLMRNHTEIGAASWQIPLLPYQSVHLQTSTNLVDWFLHVQLHSGERLEWLHYVSDAQRYFRIVPHD